jgi:hypothetical protein
VFYLKQFRAWKCIEVLADRRQLHGGDVVGWSRDDMDLIVHVIVADDRI